MKPTIPINNLPECKQNIKFPFEKHQNQFQEITLLTPCAPYKFSGTNEILGDTRQCTSTWSHITKVLSQNSILFFKSEHCTPYNNFVLS